MYNDTVQIIYEIDIPKTKPLQNGNRNLRDPISKNILCKTKNKII